MAKMPDIRRQKKAPKIEFSLLDPNQTKVLVQANKENSLQKSVLNLLNAGKVERLAFEQNPDEHTEYFSIYKPKLRLLPAEVIKRIAIQDDLVAAICTARANHVKAFGREQVDRYSTGYRIEPRPGVMDSIKDEQVRERLLDRINKASKLLSTCGHTTGWEPHEQMSFSTYLAMAARDAVSLGQFATEIIWALDLDGERKFHSFRPADAGTMFRAVPKSESTEQVRKDALRLLERIKNDRLEPERFENDEYAWIQVINGQPRQAFTGDEMVVINCYPVTNVELNGYPLSPLDTVIAAVTTHINITSHNKMYFQTGRAAKGMLVIKSADVDDKTVKTIRQQFNASINGVSSSWRMPVFGVGPEDEIAWQPIDQAGSRDMEFQYLSDQNARVILSAFQMSPEELPGYMHLSRGTNSQALAESNPEWKLTAARDVGIRPLLAVFQDFLNDRILPLLDPVVAKCCWIRLVGLDADTPEREAIRADQDQKIYETMNGILARVEKDPIDKKFGGDLILNPLYHANVLDKYLTVGEILEEFFGRKGASQDPMLAYRRDPFWFNQVQIQLQIEQMKMQQAMMQQQAAMEQAQQGGPPPNDGGGGGPPPEREEGGGGDLSTGLDQLIQMVQKSELSKAEKQLPAGKRKLVKQHELIVKRMLDEWEADAKKATEKIASEIARTLPKQARRGKR